MKITSVQNCGLIELENRKISSPSISKAPVLDAGADDVGAEVIAGPVAKVDTDEAPGGTAATTERRGPVPTAATVTTAEADMTLDCAGTARSGAGCRDGKVLG